MLKQQATTSFPQFPTFEPPTSRPLSLATNVSVELGGYQVALEEVLTWLLEAEDVLNHAEEPGTTLEELKRQFREHEAFLVELSGHQDGVGAVLEEGERLLAEGGLQKDEEHEVRVQMSLLNSRWENLRKRALDRQSKIHQVTFYHPFDLSIKYDTLFLSTIYYYIFSSICRKCCITYIIY